MSAPRPTDPPRAVALPAWGQPASQRIDPPIPGTETAPTTPLSNPPPVPRREPSDPRPPAPDVRTRTYSGGDPKEVAKVIGGLIALGVGIAAWVVLRAGRTLRRPTDTQLGDMAQPLGRILARHVETSMLNADLADATQAVAAASNYLIADGPLTTPAYARPDTTEPEDPT